MQRVKIQAGHFIRFSGLLLPPFVQRSVHLSIHPGFITWQTGLMGDPIQGNQLNRLNLKGNNLFYRALAALLRQG